LREARAQRGDHGLGHAAAAAQQERLGRVGGARLDQLAAGGVIGVVASQVPIVVDDRVDAVDGERGRLQRIDQRNHRFLERHRDRAAANIQRADAGNRSGQVARGERLVDVIQAQRVIEIVVQARSGVAGATGQRHAQAGVAADGGFEALRLLGEGLTVGKAMAWMTGARPAC
jgi:hypothetical protein